MSLRAFFSKTRATWTVAKQRRWRRYPLDTQLGVLEMLIREAQHTLFGHAHRFNTIKSYADFKRLVPARDYAGLAPYIRKIEAGAGNVLWPTRPLYLARTARTTSEGHHIPITQASLPHYFQTAQDSLACYIHETGKTEFLTKKTVALTGNPRLSYRGNITTGTLSAILNHHLPAGLQRNVLPSYKTNCIEDWQAKIQAIVEESRRAKVGVVSGIPPWIQMYFDELQNQTGKAVKEVFPELSLLIHEGVPLMPYKDRLLNSLGPGVDLMETYQTAEGFIAFQDSQEAEGLLLQLNSGMFFEFIPSHEYGTEHPTRLCIAEVELGVDYVIILTSNAGLWAYALGDTVRFVSQDPYRIVVTGRIQQFISAFGERVIATEVDQAMQHALKTHPETALTEFTVAPKIIPEAGAPSHHEWLVEFARPPHDLIAFAKTLDQRLYELNGRYKDLIMGKVLQPIRLKQLPVGTFQKYRQSYGRLGGHHKVIRLANDRVLADSLLALRS